MAPRYRNTESNQTSRRRYVAMTYNQVWEAGFEPARVSPLDPKCAYPCDCSSGRCPMNPAVGRPAHRQDAGLERLRRRRPGLNHLPWGVAVASRPRKGLSFASVDRELCTHLSESCGHGGRWREGLIGPIEARTTAKTCRKRVAMHGLSTLHLQRQADLSLVAKAASDGDRGPPARLATIPLSILTSPQRISETLSRRGPPRARKGRGMVFFPENRGAPPVRLVDSSSASRAEETAYGCSQRDSEGGRFHPEPQPPRCACAITFACARLRCEVVYSLPPQ